MVKKRTAKDDDQERSQEAYVRIGQTILEIQEDNIEPTLIMAALWSLVVDKYIDSGFSFNKFKDELQNVAKNYKGSFDT